MRKERGKCGKLGSGEGYINHLQSTSVGTAQCNPENVPSMQLCG
jgi:hypothetical protein